MPRYIDGMLQPWITQTTPRLARDAGRVLYRFRAWAVRDGREVVSVQHRLVFVPGSRLTLPLRLDAACVARTCLEDQTCGAGTCRDDLLPACSLEDGEPSPFCRGLSPGLDSGARDGATGPADASTDVAPARDARADTSTDALCSGACAPGASSACGCTGMRTCGPDCAWGPCVGGGPCSPGDIADGCGHCGLGSRECGDDCDWGPCRGGGTCSPGDVSGACGNCGLGSRECGDDCEWGGCVGGGACSPGETRGEVTGLCSPPCMSYAYVPTCNESCDWENVYSQRCMGGC